MRLFNTDAIESTVFQVTRELSVKIKVLLSEKNKNNPGTRDAIYTSVRPGRGPYGPTTTIYSRTRKYVILEYSIYNTFDNSWFRTSASLNHLECISFGSILMNYVHLLSDQNNNIYAPISDNSKSLQIIEGDKYIQRTDLPGNNVIIIQPGLINDDAEPAVLFQVNDINNIVILPLDRAYVLGEFLKDINVTQLGEVMVTEALMVEMMNRNNQPPMNNTSYQESTQQAMNTANNNTVRGSTAPPPPNNTSNTPLRPLSTPPPRPRSASTKVRTDNTIDEIFKPTREVEGDSTPFDDDDEEYGQTSNPLLQRVNNMDKSKFDANALFGDDE